MNPADPSAIAELGRTVEGKRTAAGRRWTVVAASWHDVVMDRLVDGALEVLTAQGADPADITLVRVPGAYELPLAVQQAARSEGTSGVIALGCVIRGETPHFDFVAQSVSMGIMQVQLETDVPVGFGVLTTDTLQQALARAGQSDANKGREAAYAAMEMVDLAAKLNQGGEGG